MERIDIEYLKNLTNASENMLWINTTSNGMAAADYLETAGIKINRFTHLDQPELQEYLRLKKQKVEKNPNE